MLAHQVGSYTTELHLLVMYIFCTNKGTHWFIVYRREALGLGFEHVMSGNLIQTISYNIVLRETFIKINK